MGAVALTIPNVVWIARDRGVWPWDPSWYGEVSVDLWASATRSDSGSWPGAMLSAFGMKPPAIAWIGQFSLPLRHAVGAENAMLLSIVATQIVALVLFGAAASRLTGRALAGATALVGLAAAPLFMQLGHEYFPESLQTLAVAWTFFILASARTWRLSLTLTQLGGAVALGLLAKLTTPVYAGVPAVAALLLAVTAAKREVPPWWRDRRVQLSGALMLALALGAIGWYSRNLSAAVAHARDAQSSALYGVDVGPLERVQSWSERIRDASFLPWFGIAVLLLLGVAAVLRFRSSRQADRPASTPRGPLLTPLAVGLAAAIGTILVTLAVFSKARPQDPRYLLGVVPSVVLAVSMLLAWLGVRRVAVAALVLFSVQFVLSAAQELDVFRPAPLAYAGLQPPDRSGAFAGVLRDIVRRTCTAESAGRISMLGVDYPWMNSNLLQMYAAEEFRLVGRPCYYTPLGYAETNTERAWQRLLTFKPPYFIALDYGNTANPLPPAEARLINPDDAFNVIDRALTRRVWTSGRFAVVPGMRRSGLVVLRATK